MISEAREFADMLCCRIMMRRIAKILMRHQIKLFEVQDGGFAFSVTRIVAPAQDTAA